MRIQAISAVLVFTATGVFADATLQQKTQVHFGGALGGVVNVFGGKATREGITHMTALKGDRKATRTEDHGEIVDLGEEKVYTVDYGRKTYSVKTFAEMRREFEDAQERAKKHAGEAKSEQAEKGPEWDVDFNIKSTGNKQEINGWNTHEEIVTITVHEKGKKIEQSGGFVLTSDMWMGPKIPAMRELADFDRRFVQKVYGSAMDAEMVKAAAAMAATPQFGKAMKALAEHRGSFEGTPIRTVMTFDTVPGPATQQQNASNEESPQSPGAAVFGGLMRKMKERQAAKKSESGETDKSTMFDSTTELLSATTSASSDAVSIPAGFKQR
jgi:hypothetical protein